MTRIGEFIFLAHPRKVIGNFAKALTSLVLLAATSASIASAETPLSVSTKKNWAATFVREFLRRDANASEVFRSRTGVIGAEFGTPVVDCPVRAIVHDIRVWGEPEVESQDGSVVSVPVVAVLAMLMIDGEYANSGESSNRNALTSTNPCSFEYQRFNPETGAFDAIQNFHLESMQLRFRDWGDERKLWDSLARRDGWAPSLAVAVAPDKNVVRFSIRVRITRDGVFRIEPQVPRHWFVQDAINRLEILIRQTRRLCAEQVSDRDESASGAELQMDLERMSGQILDWDWERMKLLQAKRLHNNSQLIQPR